MKHHVPGTLDEILSAASELGVNHVSFEYDSSGALEVTYYSGNTGIGVAVADPATKQRIISELVDRAGLETRSRGTIRTRVGSENVVIRVEERDHFGESAFDLRFG